MVEISSLNGDEEGYSFAEQLQAALREAGWQITAINSAVIAGLMPTGLLFLVRDPANPPQQVSTLRDALKKIGFNSVLQPTNDPEDGIALLVGKKPKT